MPIIGDKLFIYSPDQAKSVAKILLSKPDENRLNFFGSLFGIIEFSENTKNLYEVLEEICAELEATYYDFSQVRRNGIDIEEHFETSLKNFNPKLQSILTKRGLDTSIDRLNMIVGVVKKNQLFFSYVGKMYAFLIYKHSHTVFKVADIIGNLKGNIQEPKPDLYNFFTFILNGRFRIHDYLLICNRNMIEHVPIDSAKDIIIRNTPYNSVEEMRNLLWQASVNTTFASIILHNKAGVDVQRRYETDHVSQRSLNKLLSTEDDTEKLLSMSLSPNIRKYQKAMAYHLKKNWGKLWSLRSYVPTQNINTVNTRLKKVVHKIARAAKTAGSRVHIPKINLPKLPSLPKPKIHLPKFPMPRIAPAKPKTAKRDKPRFKMPKIQISFLLTWVNGLKNRLHAIYKPTRDRIIRTDRKTMLKIGAGFVAIVFITIFVRNLVSLKEDNTDEKDMAEYLTSLANIEENLSEVEAALIYNDKIQANMILQETLPLLLSLPSETPQQEQELQRLNTLAQQYQNSIHNIVPVNESDLFFDMNTEFGEMSTLETSGIIVHNTKMFLYTTGNSVYLLDPSTKIITLLSSAPNTPASIDHVAQSNAEDEVILSHTDRSMSKLNTKDAAVSAINISFGSLTAEIADIDLYNNRLYTLIPSNNQILRHNPTNTGYSAGSAWLRSDINISDTRSIAIDGFLYLLKSDGTVMKFNNGAGVPFTLENRTQESSSPTKIDTDLEFSYLYILDGNEKKVLVYDKTNGAFIKQFVLN
ncbi:MAG TPA: hypothetical protein VJA22_01105, partial [Patescibacteria group bacterium]|nr:hypothetical protein [Patescibacteria group bacterium]